MNKQHLTYFKKQFSIKHAHALLYAALSFSLYNKEKNQTFYYLMGVRMAALLEKELESERVLCALYYID